MRFPFSAIQIKEMRKVMEKEESQLQLQKKKIVVKRVTIQEGLKSFFQGDPPSSCPDCSSPKIEFRPQLMQNGVRYELSCSTCYAIFLYKKENE